MTTVDNQSDGEEQKHPISPDIVKRTARDLNIRRQLLDDVLTDMAEIWDPYRDELEHLLRPAISAYPDMHIDPYTMEDAGVIVLGGPDLTVIDVLCRIDLEARLEQETISKVGIAHAVWVVHKQEAKRQLGHTIDIPIVVRQQK